MQIAAPAPNLRRFMPMEVVAAGAQAAPAPLAEDPTAARKAAIGYRRLSPYHPKEDFSSFSTPEAPPPVQLRGRGEQLNATA